MKYLSFLFKDYLLKNFELIFISHGAVSSEFRVVDFDFAF